MTDIEELEAKVSDLPTEKLAIFRDWFYQFADELWDAKIAADFRAGKLNNLIEKARLELSQGKAREIC
ncbi:MAG: hypothetical protein NTW85_03695 [Methylococcales bacterium]|nr:hypothetical protein [Methylococcales bacterium]